MSLGAYTRASIGEFALLLLCVWALETLVMDGFYVSEGLQFGVVPACASAVLLIACYFAAWRHRTLLVGSILVIALVAALIAVSLALSGSPNAYEDAFGNWFWAAVAIAVVTVGGFLLTRTVAGAGAWFVSSIFAAALVQMMFETGRLWLVVAVLFSSLALLVYRNFRVGMAQLDSASDVSALAVFLVATVPLVALIGLAGLVWVAIIAPLDPPTIDPHLIVEYRKENIEQVRGVGNTQMRVNTEMTSDSLVEGDRFTTDDLLIDEEADTAIDAKAVEQASTPEESPQDEGAGGAESSGESAGNREEIDRESIEDRWDAISYTERVPLMVILAAILGLLLLLLLAYFLLRRWYRARRLERFLLAGDAGEQAGSIYLFLLGKLSLLGFSVPTGSTLAEYARDSKQGMEPIRLETRVPFSYLTEVYAKVAYADYQPTEDELAAFVGYYLRFWKAVRRYLGNVRYFFKSFRLG